MSLMAASAFWPKVRLWWLGFQTTRGGTNPAIYSVKLLPKAQDARGQLNQSSGCGHLYREAAWQKLLWVKTILPDIAVVVFACFLIKYLSCLGRQSEHLRLICSRAVIAGFTFFGCAFPLCAAFCISVIRQPQEISGSNICPLQPCGYKPNRTGLVLLLQVEASPPNGAHLGVWGSLRPWWASPTGVWRSWCSLGLPLGTSTSGRRPCCWGQWRPMMDLCLPCMHWTRYLSPYSTLIFVALDGL